MSRSNNNRSSKSANSEEFQEELVKLDEGVYISNASSPTDNKFSKLMIDNSINFSTIAKYNKILTDLKRMELETPVLYSFREMDPSDFVMVEVAFKTTGSLPLPKFIQETYPNMVLPVGSNLTDIPFEYQGNTYYFHYCRFRELSYVDNQKKSICWDWLEKHDFAAVLALYHLLVPSKRNFSSHRVITPTLTLDVSSFEKINSINGQNFPVSFDTYHKTLLAFMNHQFGAKYPSNVINNAFTYALSRTLSEASIVANGKIVFNEVLRTSVRFTFMSLARHLRNILNTDQIPTINESLVIARQCRELHSWSDWLYFKNDLPWMQYNDYYYATDSLQRKHSEIADHIKATFGNKKISILYGGVAHKKGKYDTNFGLQCLQAACVKYGWELRLFDFYSPKEESLKTIRLGDVTYNVESFDITSLSHDGLKFGKFISKAKVGYQVVFVSDIYIENTKKVEGEAFNTNSIPKFFRELYPKYPIYAKMFPGDYDPSTIQQVCFGKDHNLEFFGYFPVGSPAYVRLKRPDVLKLDAGHKGFDRTYFARFCFPKDALEAIRKVNFCMRREIPALPNAKLTLFKTVKNLKGGVEYLPIEVDPTLLPPHFNEKWFSIGTDVFDVDRNVRKLRVFNPDFKFPTFDNDDIVVEEYEFVDEEKEENKEEDKPKVEIIKEFNIKTSLLEILKAKYMSWNFGGLTLRYFSDFVDDPDIMQQLEDSNDDFKTDEAKADVFVRIGVDLEDKNFKTAVQHWIILEKEPMDVGDEDYHNRISRNFTREEFDEWWIKNVP